MNTARLAGALVTATVLAAGVAACNRSESSNAAPQTQTTTAAPPVTMTTTVTGCLRAGTASDTYVLASARAQGANTTATYQLVGANAGSLQPHVGERVQISGTVTSGEQVASRSTPETEPNKATGTSGTPTVQTQTDVQIRQLRVDRVSPQGEKCQ